MPFLNQKRKDVIKVLSIDLDYIMGPTIELYQQIFFDDHPTFRWNKLFTQTNFRESHLSIDQGNLVYCYHLFLKALKNNPLVSFGYDHDAILFGIKNYDKIDLINIDHHDDVLHADGSCKSLEVEYMGVSQYDRVCEGNWIAWLHSKGKLNSCTWIHNENSDGLKRNDFHVKLLGDKYKTSLRQDYKFEDYNFDHVFVCLSPQYTPPNHWHYFSMFMMAYEEMTGKEIDLVYNTKHQLVLQYDAVTKAIGLS